MDVPSTGLPTGVIILFCAFPVVGVGTFACLLSCYKKKKATQQISLTTRGCQVWHASYKRDRAYHYVALFVRNYKYELHRLPSGDVELRMEQYNRDINYNTFNPEVHAEDTALGVIQGEMGTEDTNLDTFGSPAMNLGGNKDGYQILLVGYTEKTHAGIEAVVRSLVAVWDHHVRYNCSQTFTKMVAGSIVNANGRTSVWPVAFGRTHGPDNPPAYSHASGSGGGGGGIAALAGVAAASASTAGTLNGAAGASADACGGGSIGGGGGGGA